MNNKIIASQAASNRPQFMEKRVLILSRMKRIVFIIDNKDDRLHQVSQLINSFVFSKKYFLSALI
jgi:hypothetical protein